MEKIVLPTTAGALAAAFGAELVGDPNARISKLSPLGEAGEGSLSFCVGKRYLTELKSADRAVVLTTRDEVDPTLRVTFLLVKDPQSTFFRLARNFAADFVWGDDEPLVSPQAIIHPSAILGASVRVGPFAFVGKGTRVGDRSVIAPFAYLGDSVTVGKDSEIHPQAVLHRGTSLGDRVKVFTGACLGSSGFGFSEKSGVYEEIPQIGRVVVEDDVRIGVHCTIDRATLGETRIGRGSKLDNAVHVAHNCQVGPNSILCAQVGLGGSAVIEENVILGGQVGLGHGVKVGRGARMGGQSGSSTNVEGGKTYFMTPAIPIEETVKVVRHMRRLPMLWKKIKRIEEVLGIKSHD